MHTDSAVRTVNRLIGAFPKAAHLGPSGEKHDRERTVLERTGGVVGPAKRFLVIDLEKTLAILQCTRQLPPLVGDDRPRDDGHQRK